jgi:hypothetical protein
VQEALLLLLLPLPAPQRSPVHCLRTAGHHHQQEQQHCDHRQQQQQQPRKTLLLSTATGPHLCPRRADPHWPPESGCASRQHSCPLLLLPLLWYCC